MSADQGFAAAVALLERVLEMQERQGAALDALRAEVRALHRGQQGLDAGRAKAIRAAQARAAYVRVLVVELAAADAQAGRTEWGRAGRVARKSGGRVSESNARKILASLSSESDSPLETRGNDVDKGPSK